MSKKKVQIRLNGDSTQKYNFGNEDWKDGGTVQEVSSESAKELVEVKRIAHYVDTDAIEYQNVSPEVQAQETTMMFDQDQSASK